MKYVCKAFLIGEHMAPSGGGNKMKSKLDLNS